MIVRVVPAVAAQPGADAPRRGRRAGAGRARRRRRPPGRRRPRRGGAASAARPPPSSRGPHDRRRRRLRLHGHGHARDLRGRRAPSARPRTRARGCTTPTRGSRASAPDSELCALNADPRAVVPARALLCAAVDAGRWAAERDGRPRRPDARRRARAAPATRARAPASRRRRSPRRSPARRRAGPPPRARTRAWRAIVVDDAAGTIRAPAGPRARHRRHRQGARRRRASRTRLAGTPRFAVDCGGDVRVGGAEAARRPFEVEVEHPLTGEAVARRCALSGGAVATSGIGGRIWRAAGRRLRAPPARPGDRRAGVDRAHRRDRARADRARGRDAREGGAALRPGRRAALLAARRRR